MVGVKVLQMGNIDEFGTKGSATGPRKAKWDALRLNSNLRELQAP